MKFIRASVAGFGALQNYEYSFRDKLNCILSENGTGKTTFAAFLLAMLYGMDAVRSSDKTLKDRAHYAPWNGGRYGGTLELSAGGRIYRIERSFDRTSPARDVLAVYDMTDGAVRSDLSPSPGEAILGIPKEIFGRTVFLSENDAGSAEGVSDKLSALINGSPGDDRFAAADAILTKARKTYKPDKGHGGSIERVENELKEAERELRLSNAAFESAGEHEAELLQIDRSISEKEALIARYHEQSEIRALLRRSEELRGKENEAKEALSAFAAQHGEARLSDETLERCGELMLQSSFYRERAASEPLEEGEKAELARLTPIFGGDTPTDRELTEIRTILGVRKEKNAALEKERAAAAAAERRARSTHFGNEIPTSEEIEELDLQNERYLEAKREKEAEEKELLERARKKAETPAKRIRLTGTLIAALIVSMFFLALGIVFSIVGVPLPFIWFILSFGALLFVALRLFLPSHTAEEDRDASSGKEEAYRSALERFSSRLNQYGYYGEDPSSLLAALKEERTRCMQEQEHLRELKKGISRLEEEAGEQNERLDAFYRRFPQYASGDEEMRLNYLKEDCDKYKSILTRRAEALKSAEKDRENAEKARNECLSLLQKEGVSTDSEDPTGFLEKERALTERQKRLEDALNYLKSERRRFESEHPDLSPEEASIDDLQKETVEAQLLALRASALQLQKKLEEEERLSARREECRTLAARCAEDLDRMKNEYRILSLTREYLLRAEQRLLGRYSEPLKDRYAYYASQVCGELAQEVYLSPRDLSPSFGRAGELRSVEWFSAGLTALSDVCMRLALIDVVYPEERPFLVLDDPFAYLDDRKLKSALEGLEKLSFNTQILYFTCHSGRSLKESTEFIKN